MKIKGPTIVIYGIALVAATALILTSQKVQESERELRGLQAARIEAQDNLRLLNAEWAYLTRPSRIEELATAHLAGFGPTATANIRDNYDFPTPVISELPSSPSLMPQQANYAAPQSAVPAATADETASAEVVE
ncbi:MAG: hypothetical protein V4621_00420 [Pseudomonadota bacterium]